MHVKLNSGSIVGEHYQSASTCDRVLKAYLQVVARDDETPNNTLDAQVGIQLLGL